MTIKLTEYARGGGCAAKLRLGQLSLVLDTLVKRNAGAETRDIVVDHEFSDDAAVVHHTAGRERDEAGAQLAQLLREAAAQLVQRYLVAQGRIGGDEVGHGFGLGQVQGAV